MLLYSYAVFCVYWYNTSAQARFSGLLNYLKNFQEPGRDIQTAVLHTCQMMLQKYDYAEVLHQ